MGEFEWDPEKEVRNIEKHGLDFSLASLIWEGPVFERPAGRKDYGEDRVIALGEIEGRAIVVVYTWRGETRRLISARKANEREQKAFRQARPGSAPSD